MSQTTTTTPTPQSEHRLGAARLLAYYGLLLLFMLLLKSLLYELTTRYDLQQFQHINESVMLALNNRAAFDSVVHTVFSLFLSLMFTLPLAWVYTLTKDDESFDPSLVQTLVVLSMTVTGVMIVVGTELARAFSLAGVVAAVRFRNTLDDPKDTVYIFIAIAIGMANGARAYPIAVWISIVMTATMYLLWKYHFGSLLRASSVRAKKGKGRDEAIAWVRDEGSLQAAQQVLDQQVRLLQWASMPGKDKKKLNSALVVDASDLDAAQRHVDSVLSRLGGKWRLACVTSNGGGQGVLEYVGRLPKESTAAALMTALRDGTPGGISAIEYRSLKGLRPLALASAPPPGDGTARAVDSSD